MVAEEIVGDENQHHRCQPEAGGAPRRLQGEQEQHRAEEQVGRRQVFHEHDAVSDAIGMEKEIDSGGEAEGRHDPVVDRRVDRIGARQGADDNEHQHQHGAQEHGGQLPRVDKLDRGENHEARNGGAPGRHGVFKPAFRPPSYADGKPCIETEKRKFFYVS